MSSPVLLSPSGEPYSTSGFQSLSEKTALNLRTGSTPKSANSALPRWCPTLDVLAVPEGHALRLIRLSGGQTVWRRLPHDHPTRPTVADTKKPTADPDLVCALAWNPAGTYIAVAYADGRIVQREPMYGEIIHEARIEIDDGDRVVSLQWVGCASPEANGRSPDHSADVELALPKLAPLGKGKEMPGHISLLAPEYLTAMVAVTSRGIVWVSLYGTFALPLKKLATPDGTVITAGISSDTRRLFIVTASGNRHEKQLSVLNTSLLASSSPLLGNLASSSARLSGLCLYLDNTTDSIIKECAARDEGASRQKLLDSFESVLRDHGVDEATSPEAELIRLAVTGRPTDSSSQFLLDKFKAMRLKRWESAGRLGAVDINRLVYMHALPAIERTVLAVTNLLNLVNDEIDSTDLTGKQRVCSQLQQALILLGWLYSRFEGFMLAVREEQRENQEFVDWALMTIEDIIWQNGGASRAAGHDDHSKEEDGARPVRPHVDYMLLLRFIRSAFHRSENEYARKPSISDVVSLGRQQHTRELVDIYVDVLVERTATGGAGDLAVPASLPSARYSFHSEDIMNEALKRAGVPEEEADMYCPPTCQEMLRVIRGLVDEALGWSSHTLGQAPQWDADHVPIYAEDGPKGEQLVDMCQSGNDEHGLSEMYLASVAGDGKALQISRLSEHAEQSTSASIELAIQVRNGNTVSSVPVSVSGISFFDDSLLGIAFTAKGFDTPFLGALAYRDSLSVRYSAIGQPKYTQALTLSRLQVINGASPEVALTLSSNGARGRRCIAVVEKRGRQWWPFDMDEEDELYEDENDE